jgi:hypothetical protein
MRKNNNTWIILAVIIILAAILYYFFYRNSSISPFQNQSLCPYSALTDIIKYKSGKFPELTSLPNSCSTLSDGDFYSVIPNQTPLYNTYYNLLSESSIVKKFFDTGRNSSGSYVLAENPYQNAGQLAFSAEVAKYITAIVDGISAVKEALQPADTALLATVTGILSKYGPESQIIKDHGSIAEYIKTLPINYSNKTPEQILMDILSNFKSFDVVPGCNDQLTVSDISLNYDNILDFVYVLKLLYGIVKAKYSTATTPGLTFAMLKGATDSYTVIKEYYIDPMNAFTGYNKNSYATDDAYMTAIISNINNDIYTNIANDGKIKQSTAEQDILYTRLKLFTNKCTVLSGNTACYTTDVKNMCEKLKYIIDYTGSIEDIDVVGYSLPTVAGSTSTTATGSTSTTAAGATSTTAAGSTSTTAAGATSTTAAGSTSTTAAGSTSTTAAGATSTTAAGATSTTAAGSTSTTAAGTTSTTTPMIFDLASQLDYQKFLDDLSVLFTGRTGDPSEVVNTLLNLNQEQRNSICSTYCNGLYTECTDICKLARCENCTGGIDNTLTGAGRPSTSGGYSNYTDSYNLLDNISDNQFGLGGSNNNGQSSTSSHVGPMLYQKDGDGISNIFAPYVLVQPAASGSGAGYSSFMLNNPNDPLYKAYLSKLISDYQNAQ